MLISANTTTTPMSSPSTTSPAPLQKPGPALTGQIFPGVPAPLPTQPSLTSIKVEGSIPVEIRAKHLSATEVLLANIPFLVTICVIVAAALVNYFVNRKTIENQDRHSRLGRQAEHQNKVSEYRHAWLQEVRNTSSELIKTIYEAQNYLMQWNLTRGYRENGGTDEQMAEWSERLSVLWKKEKAAAAEMYKYTAKLKLLFKKNDPQVSRLFSLLDVTLTKVGNLDLVHVDDKSIADIIAELQVILKNEWEVTKSRIVHETDGSK